MRNDRRLRLATQIRRDRTVDQHVVQPDFDDMRPPGVTNHYSRIFTPNADAVSNDSFRAATDVIAGNVLDAVRSAMTCAPHYLGQRFRGSNHIRRPRQACRTKCG